MLVISQKWSTRVENDSLNLSHTYRVISVCFVNNINYIYMLFALFKGPILFWHSNITYISHTGYFPLFLRTVLNYIP